MAYSSFDEFEGLLKDEIGAKVFQRQTLSNYKDANIFKPKRESIPKLSLEELGHEDAVDTLRTLLLSRLLVDLAKTKGTLPLKRYQNLYLLPFYF